MVKSLNVARSAELGVSSRWFQSWASEAIGEVVGSASLMRILIHEAVPGVSENLALLAEWAVDRNLMEVWSKTVALSVLVREEPALKHAVGTCFNAGRHASRAEGNLLNVVEVVGRVPVEGELANGNEREFLLRPDLGQVEGIEGDRFRLFKGHHLDEHVPGWELSVQNRVVQIPDGVVGIGASNLHGFRRVEVLDSLSSFHMEFAVNWLVFAVDQFESVRAKSVHVAETVRNTTFGEQEANLVQSFRTQGNKVPHRIRILGKRKWNLNQVLNIVQQVRFLRYLQMGLRVSLLRMDEAGEENRVAKEENRSVVSDKIPNAVFRVELHGESTRIAGCVGRSEFTANGGEADGNWSLLALGEDLGFGVFRYVMSGFEEAKGTCN